MLITDISQVTTEWLSNILGSKITVVDSRAIAEGSGRTQKWFISAKDDKGKIWPLFLKTSDDDYEARFYQAIGDDTEGLAVVPCYDVVIEGEKSHLLLKDLSGTHEARPPQQLPPVASECEQIIDGLADLHAYWWDNPQLETTFGGKLDEAQLRKAYAEDTENYRGFAEFLADRLPPKRRTIYEKILEKLPNLMIRRYQQNHFTLVFEDVHMGNFLYPKQAGDKLYFIDWEQWGVKLAMNDLSYMMALFWSPERRARLEKPYLQRYHQHIVGQGVTNYTWDNLWYDYRLCVMNHHFAPVWQWKHQSIVDVWWNHLERIISAFDDLNCMELLD